MVTFTQEVVHVELCLLCRVTFTQELECVVLAN